MDFLSTVAQPQQVVARVVLPAVTFAQLLSNLRASVAAYEQRFGRLAPPTELPAPVNSAEEASPSGPRRNRLPRRRSAGTSPHRPAVPRISTMS